MEMCSVTACGRITVKQYAKHVRWSKRLNITNNFKHEPAT